MPSILSGNKMVVIAVKTYKKAVIKDFFPVYFSDFFVSYSLFMIADTRLNTLN